MRLRRLIFSGCAVASAVLLILAGAGWHWFGPMILTMSHIRKVEAALQQPAVYEPTGRLLALYCQSDLGLPEEDIDSAWLPEELNRIGRGRLFVRDDYASVEMGGGFYHFGYGLERDEKESTPDTGVWKLVLQREDVSDLPLETIRLPRSARLTRAELLTRVVAGYDALIREDPSDVSAHKGRIQAILGCGDAVQARNACAEMLAAQPEEWWPVLTNALLVAGQKSSAEAESLVTAWAKRHDGFFSRLDLAYFYGLIGEPDKAARAILEAAKSDPDGPDSDHDRTAGNAIYRGYTAAMIACGAGAHDATIALCERLLPLARRDSYGVDALRTLEDAAASARDEKAIAIKWDEHILRYDPYDEFDIEKLLGRSLQRPTRQN